LEVNLFRSDVRNVAIIAHVDHGKTTLVDAMLKQSGVFRANEVVGERILDSNDLERERGITILSKNTSIFYKDVKINIVDTPGHADFGAEVERILNMVDGVLLLVDAFEGPMPQTKYVLRKALEQSLKPIVVINKIDRPDQRVDEVLDEVLELFIELDAPDALLDFPVIYTSAKQGIARSSMDEESSNLIPLFNALIEQIPMPKGDLEAPFQILVTTLDHDEYIGRIAIGRVMRGKILNKQNVLVLNGYEERKAKISKLFTYEGLKRIEIQEATFGDIIAICGVEDIKIGETIADPDEPEVLPGIYIDEPTVSMIFSVNNSPFAGQEGDFVTSRHLNERLFKELQTNLSLRVNKTESTDSFEVCGRGELHLSILIETMRREGYEFQVERPKVINRVINGEKCEPMEFLTIDVPREHMGTVMDLLGRRKAELTNMVELAGYIRLEFVVPARGLIGFRSTFLTSTKGTGIMHHVFHGYAPYKGDVPQRQNGVMVSMETGQATSYALSNLEDRGVLFVIPGTDVYKGMIIGENAKEVDLWVNPCKKKHLTNIRSATSDEAVRLDTPRIFSLEQSLEYINDDELVEITPKSIRLRKKALNRNPRMN